MIAVDAPVLVELLTNGPRAEAAEACLRQALGSGRVVVCDAALASVCASLRNGAEALGALEEMGVHYNAVESKSALRAGEMQRRQRQRSGEARPIADFLIGAHALLQCDALGLTKGSVLKVELEGGRIVLSKHVDDAISRVRGKFALDVAAGSGKG